MSVLDKERVFLLPGEYHVARNNCEIATLLGSCVSVAISHQSKPYAAMNHYLLAVNANHDGDKGRYGDTSIETILWTLQKLAPDLKQYVARVYGGAAVVGHLGTASGGSEIGKNNIEMARTMLRAKGIPIVEEDVGGTLGRRIYFDTAKRQVVVKKIQKSDDPGAQAAAELAAKRKDIASRKTRVLVVDDSPLVRKLLRQAIEGTSDLEVCGEAGDAFEARDMILERNPDVVSLDIIMPKLDGLKFLKALSQHYPKPIVICSTIAKDNSQVAQRAKDYGAVDVIDKDSLKLYQGMDVVRAAYIPKIRHAAMRVVRKMVIND